MVQVTRTLDARTKLYEYLHVLKKEMNIKHMELVEPRLIEHGSSGQRPSESGRPKGNKGINFTDSKTDLSSGSTLPPSPPIIGHVNHSSMTLESTVPFRASHFADNDVNKQDTTSM